MCKTLVLIPSTTKQKDQENLPTESINTALAKKQNKPLTNLNYNTSIQLNTINLLNTQRSTTNKTIQTHPPSTANRYGLV